MFGEKVNGQRRPKYGSMLGTTFGFGLIRKYVSVFGTLFNEIYVVRTADDGTEQRIRVPLQYAPKDKVLARYKTDPNLDRHYAVNLPRLSFEMLGPEYRAQDHLSSRRWVAVKSSDPDKLKRQFTPVPYDFVFNLYLYVKNSSDGTYVIEQILPNFTPDWTVTVHTVPEMGEKRDIPIVLERVALTDHYEGDFVERKMLVWTLTFRMKAFLYGPAKDKPIIKFATGNVRDGVTSETVGSVTVSPGLTANGQPTSKASESVDPHEIWVDDDFGFVEEIE